MGNNQDHGDSQEPKGITRITGKQKDQRITGILENHQDHGNHRGQGESQGTWGIIQIKVNHGSWGITGIKVNYRDHGESQVSR